MKTLFGRITLFFFLAVAILILWGIFAEPNILVIRNIDISLKKWHSEHNSLKIVFLGDLHTKPIDLDRLKRVVSKVNEQKPDIVLSIGDYVNGNSYKETLYPRVIAKELGKIKSKYGFYTVLGNHDYDYNPLRIRKELEKNGIKVLENDTLPLDIEGKRLWLIGIQDFSVCHTHLDYNTEQVSDEENPVILLSHTPDVFPEVDERIELTLAGHTHGGQVIIPFYGPIYVPSKYGKKYSKGYFEEGNKKMFVTGGIGTSVFPIRFNNFPEIIILNINTDRKSE